MTATQEIGSRSRDVGWYDSPITEVDPEVRDLLETYSHYAPADVVLAVNPIRDKIWEVFPWPCVGQFRFLDLSLSRNQHYAEILASIQSGVRMLDVGCCFAQDLRKLIHDGAPPSQLWGVDVQPEFISLARDFFHDQLDHFIVADVLDQENAALQDVLGTFGIVQLGMVLHMWDRATQLAVCRRTIDFLSAQPGALVIGQAVGHLDGVESPGRNGKRIFKHNPDTFRTMWDELGRLTGTEWHVEAHLDEGLGIAQANRSWDDPRTRRLVFHVSRK